MRRQRKPDEDQVRRQLRKAAHDAAALGWGAEDLPTRQRTAMVIAAFLLDEAGEWDLADWLLLAKPEHAKVVATGVAVHALRRGLPAVWDALIAVEATDPDQAIEWFDLDACFDWSPEPAALSGYASASAQVRLQYSAGPR